ncbi:MAG: GatB/YqeY domain-containing protein [Gammaproteobacteria bacterium]|nr:GatB/YqeY domain-containing protein [Gammaproteobacteria bacterium]
MSSLKERISADVTGALKGGDKARVGALRLVLAAIKQREVDERVQLGDADILAVLERLAKQRRESIEQFARAGRGDLVAQETFELDLITSYLPEPLPPAALEAAVTDAIAAIGATSIKDMGKVMALLKGSLQGRADMTTVSALVKSRLG